MEKIPHIGSSLDDFLQEEGILQQARAAALKEAIAGPVRETMQKKISRLDKSDKMNRP